MIITIGLSILLYLNTIHIHRAITEFKESLKLNLANEIHNIGLKTIDELDVHKKYKTIFNIHNYYNEVDKINEWPYKSKSIKKLILFLLSSVLPLILSFYRFLLML